MLCDSSPDVSLLMLGVWPDAWFRMKDSLSVEKDVGIAGTDGTLESEGAFPSSALNGRLRALEDWSCIVEPVNDFNVELDEDFEMLDGGSPLYCRLGTSVEGETDLDRETHDFRASLEKDRGVEGALSPCTGGGDLRSPCEFSLFSSSSSCSSAPGGSKVNRDTAILGPDPK